MNHKAKAATLVVQKRESSPLVKEPTLILDIDLGKRGVTRLTLNEGEDHMCMVEQFCLQNDLNEEKRDKLMAVIINQMNSILHSIAEVPSCSDLLLTHYTESP